MRKFLAIAVGKDVTWEFPLGPFVANIDNQLLLADCKQVDWENFTDAEEPDGWREFDMWIREYE